MHDGRIVVCVVGALLLYRVRIVRLLCAQCVVYCWVYGVRIVVVLRCAWLACCCAIVGALWEYGRCIVECVVDILLLDCGCAVWCVLCVLLLYCACIIVVWVSCVLWCV